MQQVSLISLLEADGHALKRSGNGWIMLCPFHEDRNPSCSVYEKDGKEKFFCHACQAAGDAADYLQRYRKMSVSESLQVVNGEMEPPKPAATQRKQPGQQARQQVRKNWREHLPDNHKGRWYYRDKNGNIIFAVQRYDIPVEGRRGKFTKQIAPYTPGVKDGIAGWWSGLSRLSGLRPLYQLSDVLKCHKDRAVLVVEGEKCAEAAAKWKPDATVTTWHGGTAAWKKTSWAPMKGRRIILVADPDPAGWTCMGQIATELTEKRGCESVRLVLLPFPEPGMKGEDIADLIAKRPNQVAELMQKHLKFWGPETRAEMREKIRVRTQLDQQARNSQRQFVSLADNEHFLLLERTESGIRVRTKRNRHIITFTDTGNRGHSTALHRLCPDSQWWRKRTGFDPFQQAEEIVRLLMEVAAKANGDET